MANGRWQLCSWSCSSVDFWQRIVCMPCSVFHISAHTGHSFVDKKDTQGHTHRHCYTSNSLTDGAATSTQPSVMQQKQLHEMNSHFSFNMFLQFADLSANWKRHQSRALSFFPSSSLALSVSLFSLAFSLLFSIILSHRVHQLAIQVEFREMFFDVYALRIRHVARAFKSVCLSVEKQVCYLIRH